MKCLVTGGCGFIGSEFIRQAMQTSDMQIVNLDLLTYAGNPENLREVESLPGYSFIKGDIADTGFVGDLVDSSFDLVVNFAAESHVDRSIEDASAFLRTNVLGTQALLDATRRAGISRYVQVSTDEVYGSLGEDGLFMETTPLSPRSPYSASKAAADHLVMAAHHTHALETVITRCSNNYGPYQFPEKLIPLTILNALNGKDIPVYGDGLYVRDWIHVSDHARGVWQSALEGRPGSIYNMGGDAERANLDVVRLILDYTDQPESLIKHVTDRKGHDRRYAMDFTLIREELGWEPKTTFEQGLKDTVDWYRSNSEWLDHVTSGAYQEYYAKMDGARKSVS
jgi:dTDP-glucose 4,6-dehydratase